MPANLVTNFVVPNGARIFMKFLFDDDAKELTVPCELRTTVANGDIVLCSWLMVVRDGVSTTCARSTALPPGTPLSSRVRYVVLGNRTTPTGYTAAKTAERAAPDTQAARRAALEAHMLSAGHFTGGVGADSLAYA